MLAAFDAVDPTVAPYLDIEAVVDDEDDDEEMDEDAQNELGEAIAPE